MNHNKSAKRDLGKTLEIEPIQESPIEDDIENDEPKDNEGPALIEMEAASSSIMVEEENQVSSNENEEVSNIEKLDTSAKEDISENKIW